MQLNEWKKISVDGDATKYCNSCLKKKQNL